MSTKTTSRGANLTFNGMEEFTQKLKLIADAYPKTSERYLRAAGNKLRKQAKANTPSGKTEETYTKNEKEHKSKIKLKNSWTAKVIGFRGHSLEYQLKSRSRRYHLVERGHVQVTPGGRVTGFTQGKFFFKRSVDEFEASGEIKKQMDKFMRAIKRKLGG